jgi:hypothetical protein
VGTGVLVVVRVLVGVLVTVGVSVGVFVGVEVEVKVGKANDVREGSGVEEALSAIGVTVLSAVGEEYPGKTRKVGVRLGIKRVAIGVGGGNGLSKEAGSLKMDPNNRPSPKIPNKTKIDKTSQNEIFIPATFPIPGVSIYEF